VKRRQSRHVPRTPAPGAAERRAAEATRLDQGRRAAARLDATEPAWHVMYRPSTGELMAMAMWDPGFPLTLTDPDPHTLTTRMRAAEQRPGQTRTTPGTPTTPGPRPGGGTQPPQSPHRRAPPPATDPHGRTRSVRPGCARSASSRQSGHDGVMNWVVPHITRTDAPPVGDERTLLEAWLDHHRQTLMLKCAGLTPEQLTLRSVEPSSMTLLGLVRHMAEVERAWFRYRFAGEPVDLLYCDMDTNPDGDFDDVDAADAKADFDTFTREIELARAAAAGHSLEETFHHPYRQVEMSLRWVYLHMIEEYARHNGHADFLRERIDGITGA
jgi:uncharacterized damage-inducible protein DinB